MYYSDYTEDALQELANSVSGFRKAPLAPWVIFDNTAHGFAAANAARLQSLLEPAGAKKTTAVTR